MGFVRDLPHHLIESFKATLEEVTHADILLHITDSSRPDWESQQEAVRRVLSDLEVKQEKIIPVFNKIDLPGERLPEMMARGSFAGAVFVSARTGEGIDSLLTALSENLPEKQEEKKIFIPKERLGLCQFLYDHAHVMSRKDNGQGAYLIVRLSPKIEREFEKRLRGVDRD